MLDERMEKALNEQINAEIYSAYLYLSMSAYFGSKSLRGFAHWMRLQAQEELVHAMKFFDYVGDRGGRVRLDRIEGPPVEWDGALAAFEQAYEHEQTVTARINGLVDLASDVSDHATHNFLQWFVAEQVEEEASVDEVIQRLRLVGVDGAGMFMVDRELAGRAAAADPEAGG